MANIFDINWNHNYNFQIKRNAGDAKIQEPYNANAQSSYVDLIIVIDNDIYKGMGEDTKKVHKYCKDIANIINSVCFRYLLNKRNETKHISF